MKMSLTSNEEFDRIVIGGNFTKVTGYAECVEGVKSLKRTKTLFQFILNNRLGRRVRILAWDRESTVYEAKIQANALYSFTRLKCTPVDPSYYKEEDEVIKFELSIISCTVCTKLQDAQAPVLESLTVVDLSNIADMYGIITTDGYLTDPIEPSGKFSSGSGFITNRTFGVQINVYNLKSSDQVLPAGSHVRVFGWTYIQCQEMSNITKIDDQMLSTVDLSKNYSSPQPKRSRPDSDDVRTSKFLKTDKKEESIDVDV
ncbi:hypothetical protein KQX54_011338 [Cotesia glomerata]|uniref:Uncharacterized protein n=1 Tax=Cotesia glomerata TaxID=32391 RepID=A0AAV7HW31_COTGL|nr:hypothetical protein KQX54_011338 [Cotesia glomerata]